MKKTIWKFTFDIEDKFFIRMPKDAQLLSVQVQAEMPCLWALVDPNNKTEERCFEVFGTGYPINYDMGIDRSYIGTFQAQSGAYVFHLFERI